jgi:type II secretory pathway component PulF
MNNMELSFPTFRSLTNRRIPLPAWWPSVTSEVQRQSLLRLIAVAIEEQIPLAPLLRAWSADERGAQQRRLQKLVKLLESGRTLASSVEEVPGLLSDEAVLALRFDLQSGTRTTAIRELLASLDEAPAGSGSRVRRVVTYCAAVVPMGLLVALFIQVKIVPVFQKILQEYEMPQPESMRSLRSFAELLSDYWLVVLVLVLAGLFLMFSTRGARFLRRSILGRWFWPLRGRHVADVLQLLSAAASAGRPLPGALSTLARYQFDPTIRSQLLFARNEVEQGTDVWESLATANLLGPSEVRLLKTAERIGNRPWVLKKIASAKRNHLAAKSERAAEFLLPAVLLVLGALVLWQALAIFEPLENLTHWLNAH